MKRKAEDNIDSSEPTKKQATSRSPNDIKRLFRERLFELEDQREQYAKSQPYALRIKKATTELVI